MRKVFFVLLQCFFLSVLLLGCQGARTNEDLRSWMKANGKVKVLCTIAMINDLVKQIGGEYVDTLTLVRGELDPHTYQLVKGDDEKLAYSDIIFYNGLGLEHGPSLRSYLTESGKATGLGNLLREEDPSLILQYNGSLDPHIWTDINLWQRTVPYIVKRLSELDPEHREVYQWNGETLQKKMLQIHLNLKAEMLRVPDEKRYLVTSHDAFNYFARSYMAAKNEEETMEWQKRFVAPEGLAPDSQLSTTDIRLILDHMEEYDIHVIFPESNVSQASIWKLVDAGQEKGLVMMIASEHLYGDAMGGPGTPGENYLKMIQHNVRTIAKYLMKNGK